MTQRTLDNDETAASFWAETPMGPVREVVTYHHSDHLGGAAFATNRAGRLVSHTRWYPYGSVHTPRGPQPTRTFAGAEREVEEDLGLVQFGARWYSPGLGRWVSPDLLFARDPSKGIERLLELGWYSYGLNNPLAFTDTAGLAAVFILSLIHI